MNLTTQELQALISEMAVLFEKNDLPEPQFYTRFIQQPELANQLIDYIDTLDEAQASTEYPLYSAAIFALDICVAQMQLGHEAQNKTASRQLERLMLHMSKTLHNTKHSVSFWLPALNSFYETHVELIPELKNAYYDLAENEEESEDYDEEAHIQSIKDLIEELSDLTVFDIAENIFAQSYAMPPEFFADLVLDLYNIEEGHDIALLTLLHPKEEVREVVVTLMDHIINELKLSSESLSRLQAIMDWYPKSYQPQFSRWIKIQRKKGVVFAKQPKPESIEIKATEIDGSGSQGLFIRIKNKRKSRLAGLLFNHDSGIKDAWVTPELPVAEINRYYREAFDDSVSLRRVNEDYLHSFCEHFLALMVEKGKVPKLHLLEMQELLGLSFSPNKINADDLLEQMGRHISPFTTECLTAALKRSKSWAKNKQFTASWFEENAHIDKLVNRHCSFIDGVKVCQFEDAMEDIFKEEMEVHRDKWLFHFLWMSLWLKAEARKTEKTWQDNFFIAYAIHEGYPLNSIPILQEICHQTVINSVETMQDRRTYLNQQ